MPDWTGSMILLAAAIAVAGAWVATHSKILVVLLLVLTVVHTVLAVNGFYAVTSGLPPRPALMLGPVVVALIGLLIMPAGRRWLAKGDLFWLAALQTMRVPVELVLHEAGVQGLVPVMMTWSGTNLDVLTGLSAPMVAIYLRRSPHPDRRLLVAWNALGLLLALCVVTTAVLSLPGPMQVLNFDQPNVLVLSAPYVLLPAVIVPVAFWAHIASLVKLSRGRSTGSVDAFL